MIIIGGGGYNIQNVAKCWTYETAICLDIELDNNLPDNKFFKEFDEKQLHVQKNDKAICKNSVSYLN